MKKMHGQTTLKHAKCYLSKFALHKGLTYFKNCIFKFFHKFLNILTVRCKYSVNTLSPQYLGNSYYNLKKKM